MKRELQDYVWSVLPKEFKEEVKYEYNKTKTKKIRKECDLGFLNAHEGMFGAHNLTSDAEGEEMLTVPRKKVKEKWQRACEQEAKYGRAQDSPVAREELYYNRGILSILDTLFGSKCLPDELNEDNFATKKPQPAEPKFKVGDKVRIKGCGYEPKLHKGDIGEILDTNDKEQCFVLFKKSQAWIYVDCLEPYTEPTANYIQVDYHGADTAASTIADGCQPVTDYFDRIIKDGFRGHNRLHIAAQIVASMIGSDDWTTWRGGSNKEIWHNMAKSSLEIADALIAEAEKGGEA